VEYGMKLWNACKDHGTIIRAGSQTFDPREPGYLTLWTVLLAQAEEDLDRITRKNVDTAKYLRGHAKDCELPPRPHKLQCKYTGCTDTTHCTYAHRHGQRNYGTEPGEDIAAVLAAYQETKTITGAAKVLNGRRGEVIRNRGRAIGIGKEIPTRRGAPWSRVSVTRILIREGAIQRRTRPGAKRRAPFVLYGLLRCHCGERLGADGTMQRPRVLTGTRYRSGARPEYTAYKCHYARTIPGHGLASIQEKYVLPWVRANVDGLRLPGDRVRIANRATAQRDALTARLDRANDLYIAGKIDRERYDREAAAVTVEMRKLDDTRDAVFVPRIDWDNWPADDVNALLQRLIDHVELDTNLRPVKIHWRGRIAEWAA
jgi:hypothetical protein